MENKIFSIIMPCHNGARHLDGAINSVLSQSYLNWELLIIDDNSTDNSVSIIKNYCKLCYIDECLILHRRYNGAVSYNKKNTLIFKINYRLKLLQLICHFYSLRKRGVL